MNTMEAVKIRVRGLVQGVGFRYCTTIAAQDCHIKGMVRNEIDGSVYIEAQGEEKNLEKFIAKVKESPSPSGRVDSFKMKEMEPKEYTRFSINY